MTLRPLYRTAPPPPTHPQPFPLPPPYPLYPPTPTPTPPSQVLWVNVGGADYANLFLENKGGEGLQAKKKMSRPNSPPPYVHAPLSLTLWLIVPHGPPPRIFIVDDVVRLRATHGRGAPRPATRRERGGTRGPRRARAALLSTPVGAVRLLWTAGVMPPPPPPSQQLSR